MSLKGSNIYLAANNRYYWDTHPKPVDFQTGPFSLEYHLFYRKSVAAGAKPGNKSKDIDNPLTGGWKYSVYRSRCQMAQENAAKELEAVKTELKNLKRKLASLSE